MAIGGNPIPPLAKCVSPKNPPIPHDGIRIGEIRGCRVWRTFLDTPLLFSIATMSEWVPGEPMVGDIDNVIFASWGTSIKAGIYAFNEKPNKFFSLLQTITDARHTRGSIVVFGNVDLYGEVVTHRLGYRAQFARIVSLDQIVSQHEATAPYDKAALLSSLRRRYQLDQ